MANEEMPPPGGPVGRVQMEPEPAMWGQAAAQESGGSNMQKIALGAVALVVMVGLLVFMLWAALQPTPG